MRVGVSIAFFSLGADKRAWRKQRREESFPSLPARLAIFGPMSLRKLKLRRFFKQRAHQSNDNSVYIPAAWDTLAMNAASPTNHWFLSAAPCRILQAHRSKPAIHQLVWLPGVLVNQAFVIPRLFLSLKKETRKGHSKLDTRPGS